MIAEIASKLRRLQGQQPTEYGRIQAAADAVDEAYMAFVMDTSEASLRTLTGAWAAATRLHTQLTTPVAVEPPLSIA